VLELEKAEKAALKPVALMNGRERWAVFFRYATDPGRRELMNELLAAEAGIGMAGEVLLTISRDEAERFRLESEYKYALDLQSDMVEARREGRSEGRAEGRMEGFADGHETGRAVGRVEGHAEGRMEGFAEGHETGRAEGRTEGRVEEREQAYREKLETARKLRAMGLSPEQIAEVTGLSPADIDR
jgi:predicted transposase YdaD